MLNERGYRFLKRGGRAFKMSRQEVLDAFQAAEIQPLECFVNFQTQFGGYRLDEDLTYGLFYPAQAGLKPIAPRIRQLNGKTMIDCALKNLWQVRFELDEFGLYYEDGRPAAESFENHIAYYSYVDSVLSKQKWTHIPNDRLTTKRYRGFFDESSLSLVEAASDAYHSVLQNDEMLYLKRGANPSLYVLPHVAQRVR